MVIYELALQKAPIGIWILDPKSLQTQLINPRLIEILEVTPEESAKLHPSHLIPPTHREGVLVFSLDLFENTDSASEVLMGRPNGRSFFAEIRSRIIHLQNEEYLMVAIDDITFEKKLQREVNAKQKELENVLKEITAQNQELKALDMAKDRFFAMMTHELRTPLAAVMATTDLLVNKLYDTPEELENFLRMIQAEGNHLMELINDVLDYSKIRAGKLEFYIENMALLPVMEQAIAKFLPLAQERKIKFETQFQVQEAVAWFDSLRLRQVIGNVISNAIKYNKDEGKVIVRVLQGPKAIHIEVQDQGPGIPKGHESSVFNEFETIENVKTHHKGTGLGMPISKQLIEGMGGKIWFQSEANVGTTFYIEVPSTQILQANTYKSRPAA